MLVANGTLQHARDQTHFWLSPGIDPSVPTTHVSAEHAQQGDDVLTRIEEVANQDIEMADPPEGGYCFVVLDTNVLIDQLEVLKWFCYDIETLEIAVIIIVPKVVLSELDGLKNRKSTEWFAQAASSFLLMKSKERKSVKVQARAETCNTPVDDWERKNDLAIFDCCCYFRQRGKLVLLSSDKNLSLECEKEGIPTIQPPRQLWTSRDLATMLFGEIDRSRFHGYECIYRRSRTLKNPGATEAPPSYGDDLMDVDDEGANVTLLAETLVPSHALDSLHLQLIDHFAFALKELAERVRNECHDNTPPTASAHAPLYRRVPFKNWSVRISLDYLRTKKILKMTSPELWKFLLKRNEYVGWRRGQDWSRQDWNIAIGALREVGEKFGDHWIKESLQSLDLHIEDIFATPMRPTGT